MHISEYASCIIFVIITLPWMLTLGIWRLTCHFRKSCKWTRCPYRNSYHNSPTMKGYEEKGCPKCPPTQEEIEADEKRFADLIAFVDRHGVDIESDPLESQKKRNKKGRK